MHFYGLTQLMQLMIFDAIMFPHVLLCNFALACTYMLKVIFTFLHYLGLFPDVGGGYFLPRLSGELGMFLALTGTYTLTRFISVV